MKLREFLTDRIENHDLCPGATTIDAWMGKNWLDAQVNGEIVRLVPLWGVRKALRTHDLHHALTGYSTSIEGECEIAAWEVASGGCGWNVIFWFDRIGLFLAGLVLHRTATLRAMRRGWGRRNLYGTNTQDILDLEVRVVREQMRL